MPREDRQLKSSRNLAAERYDIAMDLRDALNVLIAGYERPPTLAELSVQRPAELEAYANRVLQAQALYKANPNWIGPIDFVISDEDADAFVQRLSEYRQALARHAFGR